MSEKKDDIYSPLRSKMWRLANLYWIIDKSGKKVKFTPTIIQQNFYDNLWYSNLILKARQLGFTTAIDIWGLDEIIFNPNTSFGIIAHDIEDAGKIFRDKIKFAYDNLPAEIRKLVSPIKNEAKELILSNGSTCRVGTSMRSGTYQILHVSEFGKICAKYPNKAKEIVTGSFPAVPEKGMIFIESTAEGNSGYFYDYFVQANKDFLQNKKLSAKDFRFHFYSWHEQSEYAIDEEQPTSDTFTDYFKTLENEQGISLDQRQKNWYIREKRRLGDDILREFPSYPDEAFRVSIEGAFYKREFNRIYSDQRICQLPYEEALPVYTFWDLGVSDDTAIWFVQFFGKEIRLIDYYENNSEGIAFYASILESKGYRYGGHYAPHDISVRDFSLGVSRKEYALKLGINFTRVPTNLDLPGGIQACRNILGNCFFDEKKTETGVKCLENYRKEWSEKNGCFIARPMHDWTSHGADAFRTLAVAYSMGIIPSCGIAKSNPAIQSKAKSRLTR